MEGKIYTKRGDKTKTDLYDGSRISKGDLRIEVLGNYDELISSLSLVKNSLEDREFFEIIENLQKTLFQFQADIAAYDPKEIRIKDGDVKRMEDLIDKIEGEYGRNYSFIIPGSNLLSSYIHLSRTIARRAERSLVRLKEVSLVRDIHLTFANRLSDLLFVLAYSKEDKKEDPFS